MTHSDKVRILLDYAKEKKISRYTLAPPLFRVLWRMGINVPPPVFLGFFKNVLLLGTLFGLSMYLIFRFVLPSFWHYFNIQMFNQMTPVVMAYSFRAALLGGMFFGVFMGMIYKIYQVRLKLPKWSEYPQA